MGYSHAPCIGGAEACRDKATVDKDMKFLIQVDSIEPIVERTYRSSIPVAASAPRGRIESTAGAEQSRGDRGARVCSEI